MSKLPITQLLNRNQFPGAKQKQTYMGKVSFDLRVSSKQSIGVNRSLDLDLLLNALTGAVVGF